jgi:hypothetical protein
MAKIILLVLALVTGEQIETTEIENKNNKPAIHAVK